MSTVHARPHMTHAFQLGEGDEIRITVERPGDPVEVEFGPSMRMLPPGLCVAIGTALATAGRSSYQAKRAQRRHAEEAEKIAQDVDRSTGDHAGDEDGADFRQHRLASATE